MGELFADGTSRPVTEQELASYEQMRRQQAQQPVPVLQHFGNPHEYLFVVLFDGTGQDINDPQQLPSNIGVLWQQLLVLGDDPGQRIGFKYVEGIGTQRNPVTRALDGAFAHTWDDKIEKAYRELADQASAWQKQDPQAQIRLAEVGYSRGAVLVPGFARLVDQYGIADPDDLNFGRDAHGNITVESTRPPLVQAGEVAQAVGLFDPVATNMPHHYDARLPASVISGFSMLAAHERRNAFPHQTIADLGMTPDGRFLSAPVPGGHSNVGGGNREGGLEAFAFNAMADYLNTLRDRPMFEHRPLPDDPSAYTIHQARGVTAVPGLDRDGLRNLRDELAHCKIVDPCRDAEPVNRNLAQQFEFHFVQPSGPHPSLSGLRRQGDPPEPSEDRRLLLAPSDPAHPDHALLEQIRAGVRTIDQKAGRDYDQTSERLSRSMLAASKDNRERFPDRDDISLQANALQRADHVVLGTDGRYAFVVEGAMQDPAHKRAAVLVEEAIRTPVEQSDRKLEAANQAIANEQTIQRQQELVRAIDSPAQSALMLSR